MPTETRRNVICQIIGRSRHSLEDLPFLKCFTYKEIKRATDGFSRLIGGGDNSSSTATYKAQFSDGFVGVVKKVKNLKPERDGGIVAFHRELLVLARLHHRHLVRLHGFSDEHERFFMFHYTGNSDEHKRFLVFDYMENGSLREIIHDPLRTPLTWRTRLKIAVDVAASLEYLCLFCNGQTQNLIVSADNILLGEDSVAKLSTFESMNFDHKVNEDSKGDSQQILFQFGALILELVTGQSFGTQGEDLVRWIEGSDFSRSMHMMVDSDLGNDYDSGQLRGLLHVARLCIRKVNGGPSFSISHVHKFLQRKVNGHSPP